MSTFLILMFIGIIGLVLMALPGFNRHGSAAHIGGHSAVHVGHGASHSTGHVTAHAAPSVARGATNSAGSAAARSGQNRAGVSTSDTSSGFALLRWIPSPRVIFSLLTMYGGFGVALTDAAHLPRTLAAVLAIVPAFLIERFVVTPLWNVLMSFDGVPSSDLTELTFQDAEAVTPFRNGKGMVTVNRDGRAVQFRATLPADQMAVPVRVGDKLRIEEVDAEHERVMVSIQ
jgi:hypothetical protein